MRVLHVISDQNVGGAGVLLTTLLRNFDPARVQSCVGLPKGSELIPRLENLGVPVTELNFACDRVSAKSVKEICQLLRQSGSELLHANAALSARIAGKLCGIPVLHTRHCCFPPSGVYRVPLLRSAGGLCNRALSDRVIATADAAAENLRRLGIPPKKISVIINGSEPIRTVSPDELASLRAQLNLREDDYPVGICARLEPYKGHETFLRAASMASRRMPHIPFRFLIVGSGSQHAELEALAKALHMQEQVRFTGFVTDMAPIYRLLRVNVNCSTGTETSCLAISEGMSAALPTVASDYGGNRAMIGDGKAGILFPAGDAHALADAICRIASDCNLESAMKRSALERFENCFTAKKMTDQVTAVYESTLKQASKTLQKPSKTV
ncbi:MAG: glycosyltransferase [Clostridia bacterium]|nr:glycosyltransferase [Clostridia bacterium]